MSSLPSATWVILLPPLFKPVFVKETVLLSSFELAGLMVIPLFVIFVTALSSPPLNSAEVKPFSSFASFTVNSVPPVVALGVEITPILLSDNLVLSVTPPFISTCLLSLTLATSPISPPYFIPSSSVANS